MAATAPTTTTNSTAEIVAEIDLDNTTSLSSNELGREPLPVDISTPNLEEQASCFSNFSLNWYWTLQKKSMQKSRDGLGGMNAEDLGRVHPKDRAQINFDRFNELWKKEIANVGKEKASLWWVWFRFVGWGELGYLMILTTITAFASTGPPIIANRLLLMIEGKLTLTNLEKGLLVAVLFLCPLISGICNSTMFFRGKRASLHAYAALTTAMYRKSLRLSPVGVGSISTGKLVHMFSSDAGTSMERVVIMLCPALLSPFQFVAYIILIYNQLGWSAFSSLGLIILIIPLNIKIFGKVLRAYAGAAGATDKRVKLVNELIAGIRIVKFYAWEKPFIKVIEAARNTELGWIKMHAYWMSIGLQTVFIQLPGLIQLAALTTYVLQGGVSDPSRIFTAIMFFQLLQQPVSQMPNALSIMVQLYVGLGRIGTFLKSDEQKLQLTLENDGTNTNNKDSTLPAVTMNNVTVSWGKRLSSEISELLNDKKRGLKKSEKKQQELRIKKAKEEIALDPFPPVLSNMTLNIMKGELVMVCGDVGSGKSSLLMTISNECIKVNGTMHVRGRTSFATQSSFCFSESLEKNITFGTKYNKKRYKKIIQTCALTSDLEQLEGGDQIILGERGINLSGGQKARVGLARACYAPSDIVLLDDVLSAVDSHVGDHIFEQCICTFLKERTVIFATNQLHRLVLADRILFVADGEIKGQGKSLEELKQNCPEFIVMMKRGGHKDTNDDDNDDNDNGNGNQIEADETKQNATKEVITQEEFKRRRSLSHDSNTSRTSRSSSTDNKSKKMNKVEKPQTLMQDEEKQIGHVSSDTYKFYLQQAGCCLMIVAVFGVGLQLYIQVGASITLGVWTSTVALRNYENVSSTKLNEFYTIDTSMIGIYGGVMGASLLSMLIGAYLFAVVRVKVAKNTHTLMLERVTKAPKRYKKKKENY